jgi:hypothetical protein
VIDEKQVQSTGGMITRENKKYLEENFFHCHMN